MEKPLIFITDNTNGSFLVVEHLYTLAFQKIGLAVKSVRQPKNQSERIALSSKFRNHIVFHNTIGPNFEPIENCYNIALPVHEWSKYPPAWAEKLSQFDQIWVTTEHVESVVRDAGTTAPIFRLSPPLDLESIPQKHSWDPHDPFRFYFCGESHFRKGLHLLLPAFIQAFPEPGTATLTIKTSESCDWDSPREDIILIKENWTRQQCLNEYQHHDCYISTSLGEGFGLPIAEAILARLPVATNFWGGHKSLLTPGSFYEIPYIETDQPYASRPEFYVEGQSCALTSPATITETLKLIVKSAAIKREQMAKDAAKALGGYRSRTVLNNIKEMIETLINRLKSQ